MDAVDRCDDHRVVGTVAGVGLQKGQHVSGFVGELLIVGIGGRLGFRIVGGRVARAAGVVRRVDGADVEVERGQLPREVGDIAGV